MRAVEPFRIPEYPRQRRLCIHLPALFHRPLLNAYGKEWEAEEKTVCWACPGLKVKDMFIYALNCIAQANWLLVRGKQKTCSDHRSFFDRKKGHQLLGSERKHTHLHLRQGLAASGRGLRILPPNSKLY